MAGQMLMLVWCVLILYFGHAKGSAGKINISPDIIQDGARQPLHINCTFSHQAPSNISKLMSIIVYTSSSQDTNGTRIFQKLAHIDKAKPTTAILFRPAGDAFIRGQIDPTGGRSYLSLKWNHPKKELAIPYRCSFVGHGNFDRILEEFHTQEVIFSTKPQPSKPQPGKPQPNKLQPNKLQPVEPGKIQPGKPQPGKPQPNKLQPVEPGKPQPGKPQPGKPQPGKPQPGKPQPSEDELMKKVKLQQYFFQQPGKPQPSEDELMKKVKLQQQRIDDLMEVLATLKNDTSKVKNTLGKFHRRIKTYVEHSHSDIMNVFKYQAMLMTTLAKFYIKSPVFRGKYYLLSKETPGNNREAQASCLLKGGYLAEINDAKEYAFIRYFLRSKAPRGVYYVYVGATETEHPGNWAFSHSHLKVGFFDWAGNSPNNVLHTCMHLNRYYDWKMVDYECSRASTDSTFLCEVPVP